MNLAHLRALAEAATKGPWHVEEITEEGDDGEDFATSRGISSEREGLNHGTDCELFSDADARYIAALNPQTVLALLRIVEAAEQLRTASKAIDDWMEDPGDLSTHAVMMGLIDEHDKAAKDLDKFLSDFRADPKATGVGGKGVGNYEQ